MCIATASTSRLEDKTSQEYLRSRQASLHLDPQNEHHKRKSKTLRAHLQETVTWKEDSRHITSRTNLEYIRMSKFYFSSIRERPTSSLLITELYDQDDQLVNSREV